MEAVQSNGDTIRTQMERTWQRRELIDATAVDIAEGIAVLVVEPFPLWRITQQRSAKQRRSLDRRKAREKVRPAKPFLQATSPDWGR
jgi:hypothetical protein